MTNNKYIHAVIYKLHIFIQMTNKKIIHTTCYMYMWPHMYNYNNKKKTSFEIQFFINTDYRHITHSLQAITITSNYKLQSSSNSLSPQTLHIFFTIFVRVRSIFRNNKISFLLHTRTTMITKNIDGKWTTPKQQC